MKIIIEANVREAKELVEFLGTDVTIHLQPAHKLNVEDECEECGGELYEDKNGFRTCSKCNIQFKDKEYKQPKKKKARKARQKQWVQEEYDGEFDVRTPNKFKKGVKKKPHKRNFPESTRRWLTVERMKLEEFYKNPDNHYSNGDMIHEKLVAFAKTLDRTPMAVSIQVIGMGLNKIKVKGKLHRGTDSSFPDFKTLRLPDDVLKAVFRNMASGKPRQNRLTLDQASSFGIEDVRHWAMFLQEVLQNANRIALHMRIKNKFKVIGQGSQMALVYA